MKSRLDTGFGLSSERSARSPVMIPASMVANVDDSSFVEKSTKAWLSSSSPLFLRAPDQAKIVATGLVDVVSPL